VKKRQALKIYGEGRGVYYWRCDTLLRMWYVVRRRRAYERLPRHDKVLEAYLSGLAVFTPGAAAERRASRKDYVVVLKVRP